MESSWSMQCGGNERCQNNSSAGAAADSPGQTEASPSESSCSPGLSASPIHRPSGRCCRQVTCCRGRNNGGLPRIISASAPTPLVHKAGYSAEGWSCSYTPGFGKARRSSPSLARGYVLSLLRSCSNPPSFAAPMPHRARNCPLNSQ